MRRRRLLLGVGALTLLGVVGFALLTCLSSPTPGVTWENFRRLRVGMSLEDAEALLGQPKAGFNSALAGMVDRYWISDGNLICLTFVSDRLEWGGWNLGGNGELEFIPMNESLLDRIRRWLDW